MALRDNDAHHLGRALRLRPGEAVTASDGSGNVVEGHWDGTGLAVSPGGGVTAYPAPAPEITVAFSLTKGAHPEEAVQKLTESGVDVIAVIVAERSVARWPVDGGAQRQMARLEEVARQAAMQCRRAWLPRLAGPFSLDAFAGRHPGLALAAPGGEALSLSTPVVAIGPEGGWSERELGLASKLVSLGPHVLRAATAATAAGVLLSALRSGLVAPAAGPVASHAGLVASNAAAAAAPQELEGRQAQS